jgi:hydrogenase nickel incorporation protein HypB
VVLLSTTEGDDKPAKYPKMFRTSDLMIISKMDLLPHVPFSVSAATEDARQIRESIDVLPVCAINGEGVAAWCQYLEQRRSRLLQQGA